MIVRSRKTRKLMSVVLMLAIMLSAICFGNKPLTTEVNAFGGGLVIPGQAYYIKNVKSGKYLTVQHASFTAGANIVQWHYTNLDESGSNYNQKWKIEIVPGTNNQYGRIVPATATNLAISLANNSVGTQAKLAVKSDSDYGQWFDVRTDLGNAAIRFLSKKSGFMYALVANGASVYDNTSIVQGQTGVQWSDQWLIEPIGYYDGSQGSVYGYYNCSHRLATYPDFDFLTGVNNTDQYESTNFASQCMNYGGKNYVYDWKCMKLEHMQNQNFTMTSIQNYWNIVIKWYRPNSFYNKWQSPATTNHVSIYDMTHYSSILLSQVIRAGDAVQIMKINPDSLNDTVLATLYISGTEINAYPPYSYNLQPNKTYIATHTLNDAVFTGNLKSVCIYYENNYNADYVRFIHVD